MNWQNYTVSRYNTDTGEVTHHTIRGISTKDVEYVATMPCKRNGNSPIVHSRTVIVQITKEDK